jgi:hypothetical protein
VHVSVTVRWRRHEASRWRSVGSLIRLVGVLHVNVKDSRRRRVDIVWIRFGLVMGLS